MYKLKSSPRKMLYLLTLMGCCTFFPSCTNDNSDNEEELEFLLPDEKAKNTLDSKETIKRG